MQLKKSGVSFAFPHLCPCSPDGSIALMDEKQTVQFLEEMEEIAILPWIGGVLGEHVFLASETWRSGFVASVVGLLRRHPKLAGIHLNIEPLPSGTTHLLTLLDELRRAMPEKSLISIAAYPPPTAWHPFPEVHWEKGFFQEVAGRADQIVPMMYDTSIRFSKVYQHLMADWTGEVIAWAGTTQVLLGIPAYEDEGVGYHDPKVENISNALCGIHRGLAGRRPLPANYAGVAIYSDWEMTQDEWKILERDFSQNEHQESNSPGMPRH